MSPSMCCFIEKFRANEKFENIFGEFFIKHGWNSPCKSCLADCSSPLLYKARNILFSKQFVSIPNTNRIETEIIGRIDDANVFVLKLLWSIWIFWCLSRTPSIFLFHFCLLFQIQIFPNGSHSKNNFAKTPFSRMIACNWGWRMASRRLFCNFVFVI